MEYSNHYLGSNESHSEERQIRKRLELLGELVPELQDAGWLETELLNPLKNADFNTRRQTLFLWDIYQIVLNQISRTAIKASVRYLQTGDEEAIIDLWASSLDRILTYLYRGFNMSSFESFLLNFQHAAGEGYGYGSA